MATATKITSSMNDSLAELEDVIKLALRRTGLSKELDLCPYLSNEREPLSASTYLKLKDADRGSLIHLIRERILNTDLHKLLHKAQEPHSPYAGQALEECIREAMAKVNVLKETALCKYLPGEEGYLHHFTFLKMKSSNPIQLRNAIKEHILDHTPQLVQPKKRNRRYKGDGSEKNCVSRSSRNLHWDDGAERRYPKILEQEFSSEKIFESSAPPELNKDTDHTSGMASAKIDQLIRMMSQLVEALQPQNTIVRVRSVDPEYRKESPSEKFFDKHLHLVQNQLIRKIRAGQADEELWGIFLELI